MRVRRRRLRVNEKWEYSFLWFNADTWPLIIIMWEDYEYVGHPTQLDWRNDTLKNVTPFGCSSAKSLGKFRIVFSSSFIRFHIIQSNEYIFGERRRAQPWNETIAATWPLIIIYSFIYCYRTMCTSQNKYALLRMHCFTYFFLLRYLFSTC